MLFYECSNLSLPFKANKNPCLGNIFTEATHTHYSRILDTESFVHRCRRCRNTVFSIRPEVKTAQSLKDKRHSLHLGEEEKRKSSPCDKRSLCSLEFDSFNVNCREQTYNTQKTKKERKRTISATLHFSHTVCRTGETETEGH